jgi:hypothetical protein
MATVITYIGYTLGPGQEACGDIGHAVTDPRGHVYAAAGRAQRDLGADFIKAALVTSEVFYAAQQECRRLGIPILGHLPNGIDVARASGEGVRSVEHLGPGVSLLACCSAEAQAVRGQVVAQPAPRLPGRRSAMPTTCC